ncbi:hypothetical protein BURPS305_1112 [Burkholderia pseudomallei 305]|nr:hypothetical protein BURPS305_1112 [Burkholderia pseudomallei 305]
MAPASHPAPSASCDAACAAHGRADESVVSVGMRTIWGFELF